MKIWTATIRLVIGLLLPCQLAPLHSRAQDASFFTNTVPALTNAAQLRALAPPEAARRLPVKLTATVTGLNAGRTIFVQDETGGTFINLSDRTLAANSASLRLGDRIAVTGWSYVGRFVPGVEPSTLRRLEPGTLPEAANVGYDDLVSTRLHYQRVAVNGIVRSVEPLSESNRLNLTVALGQRKLQVLVVTPEPLAARPPIDAELRIEGLATGHINDRRQLIAPQMLVNRPEDLQVKTPPPADPFALPLYTANGLLNFDAAGVSGHRVRVRGVVTFQQPGKAVFLRDAERGLLVQTGQDSPVQPGDVLEAVGFPAMGQFSACLEDGEFRVLGSGPAPQPVQLTVAEALLGTNDANLVSLDAQLIEVLPSAAESVLVLRAEENAFKARLPRARVAVRPGSELRLAGICRVEEPNLQRDTFSAIPRSIELLLRSPADIAVRSTPSWWTAGRLAVAAAALLVLALAALTWVMLLRRRIAEQAEVIRQNVQREAALEERHRMAREMHDTLAQSFSGLGFQLEALKTRLPADAESAHGSLKLAQDMVRYGQEGFRRSLLNLRSQELEHASLEDALKELAHQITADTGIHLRCRVRCERKRLPEPIETNLLRIGQECLTNAVRHARPKCIELTLTEEPGCLKMQVKDDGVGFNPEESTAAGNGRFGWRGIRERAQQICAQVELQTQTGLGTTITITVPV